MTSDVVDLITEDHREVERLFGRLRSREGDRAQTLADLAAVLIAHCRAEEEHVYPLVARASPDEKKQIDHCKDEHEDIEHLLTRLRQTDPGTKLFDRLVDELIRSVHHHVETEENGVLPALREAVGAEHLQRLAGEFRRCRAEALAAARRETARRDGHGPRIEDLTRVALVGDV